MVSSKDVAKYAGVSQTTVSRVLNTPELVKKPTLEKVLKAIKELNYVPDANARSLVQQKTKTIALLSGPLHNPFFVDTTTAIVNYATEKGYKVNVQFVNDENLTEAYATAIGTKVDGIILSCILYDDPIFDRLQEMNIPFITYNRKHRKNEQFVEIDNFHAGYLSAKHVIEQQHTKLGWIGGPLTVSTFKHRYEGFLKACEDYQVELADASILQTDTSKEGCEAALDVLLELEEQPTAICTGSDSIALNVLDYATKMGVAVPDDMSIVGIDNVELSQHGRVQLTTVGSISEHNLGLLAIERLIELIENKKKSCISVTESVKVFSRSTTKRIKRR
jgi:DNA-binding LacI/PurR family transcriptional regulator